MAGSEQREVAPPPPRSALTEPTLVLNRAWVPVGVTTVRTALCMLSREIARVVQPATYELFYLGQWMVRTPDPDSMVVRTVNSVVQAPEILHLDIFDRVPRHDAAYSKRNVYIRDRAVCQYCGVAPGWSRLTIDHIMPRSRGGDTSWENCVVACKPCNNRKGNRTPKEAGLTLRREPRRPAWRSFLHGVKPRPSWQPFVHLDPGSLELESQLPGRSRSYRR